MGSLRQCAVARRQSLSSYDDDGNGNGRRYHQGYDGPRSSDGNNDGKMAVTIGQVDNQSIAVAGAIVLPQYVQGYKTGA